ncbi:hypothetical protein Pelo_15669 [Pelomyxa schiedti]|nr:hypothetical protein Pelo_15669 [Pelomyxa schiedti]
MSKALLLICACCTLAFVSCLEAPLIPEEFCTHIVQNKWNMNGDYMNHTWVGTYYSSYALMMARYDGAYFGTGNVSDPTPPEADWAMSLMDFTQVPTLNTYISKTSIVDPIECYIGTAVTLPPQKSTFLADIGATFSGYAEVTAHGVCEKWSFPLASVVPDAPTVDVTWITFYFDYPGRSFVRWDIAATNLMTGVITEFVYNLELESPLPASMFQGSGVCPTGSTRVYKEMPPVPTGLPGYLLSDLLIEVKGTKF